MATAPTYCTHRQLKDVFPQVDSFDSKRPVYGWISNGGTAGADGGLTDVYDTDLDIGYCHNTGLVTQLFLDSTEINKITFNNATHVGTLNAELTAAAGSITMNDNTHGIGVGDILKINNEYMYISGVSDATLTISSPAVMRGLFNTSAVIHALGAKVFKIIDASADIGDATSAGKDALAFVYDDQADMVILIHNSLTLSDHNIEAGEDFSTLITRILGNASRYLDAKLDPNLPKEQLKDKEGNYDYIIVRTTALIGATFLIRSHDPQSEIANALMEDAQGNIDALNSGSAALSWQTTGDSSKGVIRDVTYTSGSIRPVDTRGRWSGSWDLIKVVITGAGRINTGTYSVYTKDGDQLKNNQVVTDEKISGDYQQLAGGLQIRFGGANMTSASGGTAAAADDEWEIEVAGWQEEVDNSAINSVKMTRR